MASDTPQLWDRVLLRDLRFLTLTDTILTAIFYVNLAKG